MAGPAQTSRRIAALKARLATDPSAPGYTELGFAVLQYIRETADPAGYADAEEAFLRAIALDPNDALPIVGLGGVHVGRHEFEEALRAGRTALELDPAITASRAVIVDALVELGRYDEALRELQAFVDLGESLPALARVSYLRELHGDLPGALDAIVQAVPLADAGENRAFALTLAGDLELLLGDPDAATKRYDEALGAFPGYAPALSGRARLAIGDGKLSEAIELLEEATAIVPLPEYIVALADAEAVLGRSADARAHYALARTEIHLFEAAGVAVGLELALFEADHGDVHRAVDFAEVAYEATPTVHAADALAWTLYRAGRLDEAAGWSREARRLGTLDPRFFFHAGMIATGQEDRDGARDWLARALRLDPGFSAVGAREARAALAELGTH